MCKRGRAESGAKAQSRKEGENEIVSPRGLGGGNHHGVLSGDNIYDDILLVTDSRQEVASFNRESLMMREGPWDVAPLSRRNTSGGEYYSVTSSKLGVEERSFKGLRKSFDVSVVLKSLVFRKNILFHYLYILFFLNIDVNMYRIPFMCRKKRI